MTQPVKIDHVKEGLNRLITLFKDKPVVVGLLTSYLEQMNVLEDVNFQLLEERSIYTAVGEQLNVIGALFGVVRLGQTDADYRSTILLKITQLANDGSAGALLGALRAISNSSEVDFWEHLSGNVHAYVGSGITPKLYSQVKSAIPAGVSVKILVDEMGDGFVPSELYAVAYDLQTNEDKDIQVDILGDTSVIADLQVNKYGNFMADHATLPEIEDTVLMNPLAEIVDRDFVNINGNLVALDGFDVLTTGGDSITWTDYIFN